MDFCQYHPITPATYYCNFCLTYHCDSCTDEGETGADDKCFSCNRPMEHLGAVNTVTPYWRRLQESFRYPLNSQCLVFLIIISVLTTVVSFIPLAVLWLVILSGIFMKYCFSCLESTARGLLVPPDVTEAYSGGLTIIGGLLLILLAMLGVLYVSYQFLGPQFAGLIGFALILCLPAIIIIYGMTDNLIESLNPLSIFQLISSIGLPYGLILAFIMIMTASVGVINQLIGYNFSLVSSILQSIVANYYMIVTFHIMGYMIFQYQGNLGFIAREDDGEGKEPRHYRDRLATKIDIALKDGEYNTVVTLFDEALTKFPQDKEFNKQYFEFLFATRRVQVIDIAASRYLRFLVRSHQDHLLTLTYKRVLQLSPQYIPDTPDLRHRLAQACHESGDPLSTVKLINGLHKAYPNYPGLAAAFELMANALEDLPNKKAQADQCRALAQRLAAQQPKPTEPKVAKVRQGGPTPKAAPVALALEPLDKPQESLSSSSESNSTNGDLPPIEFK